MAMYRVFNDRNVLTSVSTEELDLASRESGPMATHLVNAAALAQRHDLIGRIRASLRDGERRRKLAAARALLALNAVDALSLLQQVAVEETDSVVASICRVIALRLRGAEVLRNAFESDQTPEEIAGFIASVYNGRFELTVADIDFLVIALAAYLDKSRPWITAMKKAEWQNDVYLLVRALCGDAAQAVLSGDTRSRAQSVLSRVPDSPADHDSKTAARKWLQQAAASRS